jgi:hypothetical protein
MSPRTFLIDLRKRENKRRRTAEKGEKRKTGTERLLHAIAIELSVQE